ncbi:TrkH family potassium uptake protein [Aliagarivorans taiwanensis]|uniref:TrkH family potassium uptake protein n=1 Tax=Aliagarivorans taiwanensis TaxID=561966 RepID=UPI000428888C|nr:TrkH family potassium uptake protein [Aliagarivorans taiwanensis]
MDRLLPLALVFGLVLSKLALAMLAPVAIGIWHNEPEYVDFFYAFLLTQTVALLLIHVGRKRPFHLQVREMFLLTSSVWLLVWLFGALPLAFYHGISWTDACFEAMSGLTTTGSTVLQGLDDMPYTILLWRSMLQWLGGIGFIVLSVAILPFLNVGGMRLFQTESSDWSDKGNPKTKHVAANMVWLYLGLTLACTLAYKFSGMSWFHATNHAMTTLSTGGYSTSDESMAHFSHASHWVGSLFMFLGGMPFLLIIAGLRQRQISKIFNDTQVRGFIWLVVVVGTMMSLWLWLEGKFPLEAAIRISVFNIISIVTTTGFGLTDFSHWGSFTTVLFAFLMVCGACSGSTSGGVKLFRFQIAWGILQRQLNQLIHPRACYPQRYNGRIVSEDTIRSVIAFLMAFGFTIILLAAGLALIGLDPVTAISGAVTAVANVGPGLGRVIGPDHNFHELPDLAKWLLSFGMLLGRLEVLTFVVLLLPRYWRYS